MTLRQLEGWRWPQEIWSNREGKWVRCWELTGFAPRAEETHNPAAQWWMRSSVVGSSRSDWRTWHRREVDGWIEEGMVEALTSAEEGKWSTAVEKGLFWWRRRLKLWWSSSPGKGRKRRAIPAAGCGRGVGKGCICVGMQGKDCGGAVVGNGKGEMAAGLGLGKKKIK